ncbi:MAG: hypothetical protein RL728_1012, partial [Bacteroidota bacterium]
LSDFRELTNLGVIKKVDKLLDISNTKISDVGDVQYGDLKYTNSRKDKFEKLDNKLEKLKEIIENRKSKIWDLDNPNLDEEGEKRHAALAYIIDQFGYPQREYSNDTVLIMAINKIELLNKERKKLAEQGLDINEISDKIESYERFVDDLNGEVDVYSVVNVYGDDSNYFKLFDTYRVFWAGSYDEAHDLARQNVSNILDEGGYKNFNRRFVESHVDRKQLEKDLTSFYYTDISENPEVYFDDSDYRLTDEEEEEVEEINDEIIRLEKEQEKIRRDIEDPDDFEKLYDAIQAKIDSLEKIKSELEDKKLTDDMINDKVESNVAYGLSHMKYIVEELGFDLSNYIDEDAFIDAVIEEDGFGHNLRTYDGSYDEININGNNYIVFRYE